MANAELVHAASWPTSISAIRWRSVPVDVIAGQEKNVDTRGIWSNNGHGPNQQA